MNNLQDDIKKFIGVINEYNKSLSKYITTIIELVEVDCGKEIILEHLHNMQKVLHKVSGEYNGQNSQDN